MSTEEPTAPAFVVGGSSFSCVSFVPQWNIMRLAAAMESDEMHAMGAMYRFILSMVLPEEHEALEAHLSTLDLELADLDNAIGDALVEMVRQGKGRGRPMGIPPSAADSGPSSDGSTETAPTRRVVSLSRGTARTEPVEPPPEAATGSSAH